jgi:hypothetical protein
LFRSELKLDVLDGAEAIGGNLLLNPIAHGLTVLKEKRQVATRMNVPLESPGVAGPRRTPRPTSHHGAKYLQG